MKPLLMLTSIAAIICISLSSCFKKPEPPPQPHTYTLTLQPDSTTGQDTYVSKVLDDSADGYTNLNFAHELVMARWTFEDFGGDSATQRGYIRFDSLAKIPTKATVTSAILYLYGESHSASYPYGNSYYPGSGLPPNTGLIQRVTGGTWDQKTLTWNTAPAATSDGQDTILASTSEYNYNTSVDVTNLVKPMVASPSTNYGFMLRLVTENVYRTMQFSTCEAADSTLRPKLVVQYTN